MRPTPGPSHNIGFGARVLRFFKRLIITTVVLALGGATVFLLSELNAKTFTLEIREGKLTVLKGRLMPMGADPWRPGDPVLADAYAPLELEGTSPMGVVGVKYDDRDSLDRALFSVVESLARPRVASDDPKDLERGLYFIRRGEHLSGLTDEQRLSLKKMKADVSYYTARMKLEEGQKQIEEALAALKLAAESDTRHARSANQMILAVEPEAKALTDAVRKASTMSVPPPGKVEPAQPPALPPGPAVPAGPSQPLAGDAGTP